jgi:hypothetical protein
MRCIVVPDWSDRIELLSHEGVFVMTKLPSLTSSTYLHLYLPAVMITPVPLNLALASRPTPQRPQSLPPRKHSLQLSKRARSRSFSLFHSNKSLPSVLGRPSSVREVRVVVADDTDHPDLIEIEVEEYVLGPLSFFSFLTVT